MPSQSEFVPKTYGATPFDQFLEWEEIPVIRNFVVSDIRKLPVEPWRRRGGLGCYIILGHPKEPPNSAAYVCEIPPGQSLKPQKQMFEEMIFVLKGRGATTVWLDDGKKQTFEWQERSMFSIPLNAWHQHFNGQGGETVRYIGYTNAPSAFNLYHNYDFVFNNPYQFLDRFHGEEGYFSGKGTALSENAGSGIRAFIADIEKLQFHDWTKKGPGATNVELEFCDNIISAHITRSPVGAYKKAHRHGLGADILVLEGKGFSLMWLEGTRYGALRLGRVQHVFAAAYVVSSALQHCQGAAQDARLQAVWTEVSGDGLRQTLRQHRRRRTFDRISRRRPKSESDVRGGAL